MYLVILLCSKQQRSLGLWLGQLRRKSMMKTRHGTSVATFILYLDSHFVASAFLLTPTLQEKTKLQKRAIELNQGRAAMMGLLGLMVHEKLGNVDILLPPGGN